MKSLKCMSWAILFLVVAVKSEANAQSRATISASASETIAIAPEKLRLVMWIKAQAKDADAATLSLNEHRQRVRDELEQLKADKSSIAFSTSRIGYIADEPKFARGFSQWQQQQQQQQMLRAVGNRGKPQGLPAVPAIPTVCTAKCALKTDWILPTTDGETLAKLQVSLRDQLNSRDLAGDKNKANLTAPEQEMLDEIETSADRFMITSELTGTGTGPRITFLARVSEDAAQAATAAAFKKAEKQVQVLCDATGVKKGRLVSVNSPTINQYPANQFTAESVLNRNAGRAFPTNFLADEVGVISNVSPDDLSATYTVNVSYEIE